ncbi:hypothetical protein [Fusobacterium massiliense]|uniref:hypothetical protein n=1 Tax=Fusobacterium massiliense TaxID=1852365 RepID=UPI0028EA4901|nr:hypothetical protein [Fusobacterium massiliense]
MKKIFMFLFVALNVSLMAATKSNIDILKDSYRYAFIVEAPKEISDLVGISERFEADTLLELADEKYRVYSKDFSSYEEKTLSKSKALILIMPRIDLLEKHLSSLSKKTDTIYLFIMEKDKLDGEYGDRSYETFMAKKLNEKMPENVKVYKLTNASVTETGDKNNYEIGDIKRGRVFKEQIVPILTQEEVLK